MHNIVFDDLTWLSFPIIILCSSYPVLELQIGIFFKNVNYRLIVGADEHGLKQDTKYKDIWFEGYCMRSRPLFLHTGIKWIVQFKSMLSDEFCFLLFKRWKGGRWNFLCVRSTTHTQCSIHYHYGNSCHDHEKKSCNITVRQMDWD